MRAGRPGAACVGYLADDGRDPRDRAIVEAAVLLGRQLGAEVVAEGVESAAAWSRLRRAGCQQAQGFLLSRPVTAAELEAWERAWRADPPAWARPELRVAA